MKAVNVQFGGMIVSPKIGKHLAKASESGVGANEPRTEFGGGIISPKLGAHLAEHAGQKGGNKKTQFGGGVIYPKLAKHIAR